MAKTKSAGGLLGSLFSVAIYKRTQGQRVRQVTGLAVAVIFLLLSSTLSVNVFGNAAPLVQYGVPTAVLVVGAWLAFRIVNHPPAAEFLIGVQSELDKVSWPTWPQLWRATIVVLVVMFVLAAALFLFDIVWRFVFTQVGFLRM